MTPVKNAQLARMIRLLGRLLRVPVVAFVTGRRIVVRGLEPDRVRGLSGLVALVPAGGVVSISNLEALARWTKFPFAEDGLRFLAGTGLKRTGASRGALLVLDTRLRGPLTRTERIVLEEFGALLGGLLDTEREPERDVLPVSHPTAAPALEDAKRQAINHERLRIARELHDGFGKELFGLAMLLESVAETQKGRAVQDDLLKYAEAARRLGNEARALLRTFRESVPSSFAQALRAIVAPFQTDGFRVHCGLPEDLPEFNQAVTHELGRVVEEALENVRRHAQAKNAWVTLQIQGSSLMLRIDDDGRGIEGLPSPGRYGLTGMRERLELLGGRLVIQPGPREGTRLEARVPLRNLFEDHNVHSV
jgi:signal transduction histidine kinase